ncbi:MAG: hypothetical protein BWY06_03436 [Candidatus Latescibacteria bacterium ADurb.Bin168]|nr:MAG: hypothetical protein BWY06_03436 [Candidatus Latescibacteria bacterium ADurb.Bin168]
MTIPLPSHRGRKPAAERVATACRTGVPVTSGNALAGPPRSASVINAGRFGDTRQSGGGHCETTTEPRPELRTGIPSDANRAVAPISDMPTTSGIRG